jgi:catechol 2,3-dioxygenase-like lactoylglutathione lyase family enzyme
MYAQRIIETSLYVDDLDAAEHFYTRILGLAVYGKVAGRHVFFRCGQNMFLVFNAAATQQPGSEVPTHGAQGPGHAAFAMRHADIAMWRDHLVQNQVAIETEIEWPSGGYSLYFRDPAGNSLELTTPLTWNLPEAA